jgi:hypothetical protein
VRKIVIALVLAGLAGASIWFLRSTQEAQLATPAMEPALVAPVTRTGSAAPSAHVDTSASAFTKEVAKVEADAHALDVSDEEEGVLSLYDELSDLLEQHANDCRQTAAALDGAVSRATPELERWADKHGRRDPAEAALSEQRLKQAASARMERFRGQLTKVMAKCPTELMPTLQKIASFQGGASR